MKMVPIEVRDKIYGLCRDYLGGKWKEVEQADLMIKCVPAGNVNKLYFCCLPDHIGKDEQYSKLVVRMNSEIAEIKQFRKEHHVIAMNVIFSEKGISPKVLAVFADGLINERIDCRYFMGKDDRMDPRVQKLATKLADFHSQRIPVPKTRNPQFEEMLDKESPFTKPIELSYNEGEINKMLKELNCETHLKMNVFEEFRWLTKVIDGLKCPLVFSHNDFNRKNILIRDSDQQIYIIDFDWTNYNYRGYDFGQYFCSWAQEDEPEFGSGDFPSDQQMSVFINAYIKRMTEMFGESYAKQDINSLDRLIKESKVFALNAYLKDNMYFTWRISTSDDRQQNNENMKIAENRYKLYAKLKIKVLQEYKDITVTDLNQNVL